jgi:hypothetical protein
LKYVQYGGGGRSFGFGGGNRWTMDYPRTDRHLLPGIKRLTRIDARSIEQVVELDGSDDVYNWPTLYAVEVGYWCMPDDQPAQLRDYLNRGGFLMVDDFHGNTEWDADAIRTGAASTTRRAASSWLFATTWIWGTPGSTPTTHGIPSR